QEAASVRVFDGYFFRENARHYFQWQLFSSDSLLHFERELFLFNYVDRNKLFSKSPITISTNPGFAYQLFNCGDGIKVPTSEWSAFYSKWMIQISTIKPPKRLIN